MSSTPRRGDPGPSEATANGAVGLPAEGTDHPAERAEQPAEGPKGAERPAHPPVITVILLRHGRSTANTTGVLAGRLPGVDLDDVGRAQAAAVAERLAGIPLDRLISSPLDRCRQTLAPLAAATGLPVDLDDGLAEVDYGDWSGRALKDLAGEPLWKVVQQYPSAASFPGGESLGGMSARVVAAVRGILRTESAADRSTAAESAEARSAGSESTAGGGRTVLVCSHGDVIKALLADALGMHVDAFQRILVAPASISVIRYTELRPFVERFNDSGDLDSLRPPPPEQPAGPGGAAPTGPAPGAESSADGGKDARTGGADGFGVSDAVPGGPVR